MADSTEKLFMADVITALETTSINAAQFGPKFDGKYPIACVSLGSGEIEHPCFDLHVRHYLLQVKIYDKSIEGVRVACQEVEDLFHDTSVAIYDHVQYCVPVNHVPPSQWVSDALCCGGIEFEVIMRRSP